MSLLMRNRRCCYRCSSHISLVLHVSATVSAMSIPCGSRSHSRSRSPQAMATSSPDEVPVDEPADSPSEGAPVAEAEPPTVDQADPWDDISWIRFPDGTWLQFPDLPTHHSAEEMEQLWINRFSDYQDEAGVANTMDNVRRNPSLFEHALRRTMSSWHYTHLQPRLINFWRQLNEPALRSQLSWHHPELQQGQILSMSEAGHLINQPIFFVINYFNLTEAWHRTGDEALSFQPPEIARGHTSMNMWDPLVFQATQHYEHNAEKFTYIHKMTPRSTLRPWNNQYWLQWSHLSHVLSQHIGISWDIDFPPKDIKIEVNLGRDEPFTPTPDCNISWVLHRCFPLWTGVTPLPVYLTASLDGRSNRPLGEHIWARAGYIPGEDANLHNYDFPRYELPR